MFGFLSGVPSRVRHLLSGFRRYFTRPQYENFCRVMLGLIVAGEKEHDVKSINELFLDRKDQSSVNRFFTESKWDLGQVVSEGKAMLLDEAKTGGGRVEYKIADDTVCRKYGPGAEMVCYTDVRRSDGPSLLLPLQAVGCSLSLINLALLDWG